MRTLLIQVCWTDENVLYKAIQEKNGFSLFGLEDRDNDEGIQQILML